MSAVWIAVIAAWGGGIIGVAGSLLKDAVQWRREHSIRYNQHRIEAYTDLLAAGRRLADFKPDERGGMRIISRVHPDPPDPYREFQISFELVQIVATLPVRKASVEYYDALVNVWLEARHRDSIPPDDEDMSRKLTVLVNAMGRFYTAVRRERGTD